MITITAEQVKKAVGSKARNDLVNALVELVNTQGDKFELDTIKRLYHFLGQTAWESAGYTKIEEDLNYSIPAMRRAWPSRFPTDASAKPYAHNPQALANYTYNGRMGNRPASNDGWDKRGRGLKQLTGTNNYTAFTKWAKRNYADAPDFVKYPDKLLEPRWAVLSGVWFWLANKVYLHADADDIPAVTKAINGGTNGLKERTTATNKAKIALLAAPPSTFTGATKPAEKDEILLEYQQKLDRIATYKGIPAIDVGDPDGWFGPKTKDAIEAFQQSTGKLKVDGVLGDETKKAIDEVIAIIDIGKFTDISEDLDDDVKQPVEVAEVPVSIPNRLFDTLNKPLGENKTVWTYVSGFGSMLLLSYNKGLEIFNGLHPAVQVTILLLFAVAVYFAIQSIRDHLRAKKGFKELKQNVAEAQKTIDEKSANPV